MNAIQELLNSANHIYIVTGEGCEGKPELYRGKRTVRAIKSRLTKELCNGDRWAKVFIDCGPLGGMRKNWYEMTTDL